MQTQTTNLLGVNGISELWIGVALSFVSRRPHASRHELEPHCQLAHTSESYSDAHYVFAGSDCPTGDRLCLDDEDDSRQSSNTIVCGDLTESKRLLWWR